MSQVKFKGTPVALKGSVLEVGADAPKVTLKGKDLSPVVIGESESPQVILSVPSLDTPVCATEAREFHQKLAGYGKAEVIVVSMDLPFAMGRFCSAEGIEGLVVASDFVAKEFGEKYGVLIAEGALQGLLARAVFVVKKGKIVYQELVDEITELPNLDELSSFLLTSSCGCGNC